MTWLQTLASLQSMNLEIRVSSNDLKGEDVHNLSFSFTSSPMLLARSIAWMCPCWVPPTQAWHPWHFDFGIFLHLNFDSYLYPQKSISFIVSGWWKNKFLISEFTSRVFSWNDVISHQTPLVDTALTTIGLGNKPSSTLKRDNVCISWKST